MNSTNNTVNKVLIPTGYMNSGSSAFTDILIDFDNCTLPHGDFDFEYIFLHCPNGLFDLEDKLLIGNNALRSDEAIRSFRSMMKELYDVPFWWPGNYRKNLSPRFFEITSQFIKSISSFSPDIFWYMQEKRGIAALPKLVANKIIRTITKGKINAHNPLIHKGMFFSFPSKQEFYHEAKKYLTALFKELGIQDHNLILDQLLLPFNTWRFENYFDENVECFVVDRDPRDLFIINKYILLKRDGIPVPYPTDAQEFCNYYTTLRSSEKIPKNEHIHRFHFEDAIYHYEETLKAISKIIGASIPESTAKRRFSPEVSINNTQLFTLEQFKEEASIIEEKLSDYLYNFPYDRKPDFKSVF